MLLDRYELGSVIGQGGMARVFRGHDVRIGREVAIKITRYADLGRRSVNEARAVGKLMHPGVVSIFDLGTTEDGKTFIVMEIIEGSSLAERIGYQTPEEIVNILTGVATALDYIHAQGVVHRDVKPSNVLLTKDGMPKLTDFGIAKLLGDSGGLTRTGLVIGTPQYLSPEQVSGGTVTGASDQFSFASVAFEVLTGKLPFEGETLMETLSAIVMQGPRDPVNINTSLGKGCLPIFQRAFARKPEDRFPTCSAFITVLVAYLNSLPNWKPFRQDIVQPSSRSRLDAVPYPSTAPASTPSTLVPASSASFTSLFPSLDRMDPVSRPSTVPAFEHRTLAPANSEFTSLFSPMSQNRSDTRTRELPLTVGISTIQSAERPVDFSFTKAVSPGPFFASNEAHFNKIGESVTFYRDQLSAEYDALIKQMRFTYVLWIISVSLAMAVLLLGICLLLFHQISSGTVTTISSVMLYFLQRVFQQREDNYRMAAAAKQASVDYGNQWALVIQTIQGMEDQSERWLREKRLVEAMTDRLGASDKPPTGTRPTKQSRRRKPTVVE